MARFYSNENFDRSVMELLRTFGHDTLTTKEAGKANQGVPDEDVLAFAIAEKRILLTYNRKDFIRLHRIVGNHPGIIICTRNPDSVDLAQKINTAVNGENSIVENQLLRVYRGQ